MAHALLRQNWKPKYVQYADASYWRMSDCMRLRG